MVHRQIPSMSFFLKNWPQVELRATVLIVVENAPPSFFIIESLILLVPSCKSLLEGLLTGCALLHAKDGAPVVGIDNGNVDPVQLLEERDIALLVGRRGGEPDHEIPSRRPDDETRERGSLVPLGLLHPRSRNVEYASNTAMTVAPMAVRQVMTRLQHVGWQD